MLSNSEVLGILRPGEHGPTFGGNPLACAVAREALKVLVEEGMIENSMIKGQRFLDGRRSLSNPMIKDTHKHTIRFAPPLVITKDEVDWALDQIRTVFA